MPRTSSALVDWSDLPAAARNIREKHESGDKLCDVIYILDPLRIAREVQAIPDGAEVAGDRPGRLANACRWLARIYVRYPRDGAGVLRVLAMVDRGHDANVGYFYATASGCGYDKVTAALDGCPIPLAGLTLGDHCDRAGDPTLRDLRGRGLAVLGY